MFAQGRVDLLAGRLDLRLEEVGDERQATTAPGTGLRTKLDFIDGTEVFLADRAADLGFGDIVAGANLSVVRNGGKNTARRFGLARLTEQ